MCFGISAAQDQANESSESGDEKPKQWPSSLPAPEIVDRLGSQVTVRCQKVPRAHYTFQWTKSYRIKPSWKDATGGLRTPNPRKLDWLVFL